ncbi:MULTISPECIES: Hpt domain-containing protein [Pseudomonas]|uniref:Hpt domain-containing protein n=1 Tax=Pseudomonas sessilinigenes TaxID=658629 RepID=A0ABX8MUQ2_9PSED|nr:MULTISPECIES: Hpt domain-containing protein [Pseudomonas]AZC23414.1 Hpt domain protein [Pseudomonas sessilinigenes]QIH06953.1 Hpt domain-containing protein [Pseudomonas sp. BIOMIG1BAC]QXH42413.1 Hpt domain-containing protein [Pseudomonas sessilinigenes]UMZ13710.1 Hpt domain-containing protein [Pseudomonas sp. MPFS]
MAEIHLDHTVLNALQEVMEDEYPVLLDTFVCDSAERVRVLHKSRDSIQLVAAAHSLKGSSSNMGATRLAELCHQLELRAAQAADEGVRQLVGEIDGEFAIVRRLCEQELQRFHC